MIHIYTLDEPGLEREEVALPISQAPDMQIVRHSACPNVLYDFLEVNPKPDVLLLNILQLNESWLGFIPSFLKQYPEIHILCVSALSDKQYIQTLLQLGIRGFVQRSAVSQELVNGIHHVAEGQYYFGTEFSDIIMKYFVAESQKPIPVAVPMPSDLTAREIQILRLLCEEYTSEEIANIVCLSPRTIDAHRRNLMLKLNAKNTVGLVKYAMRSGLIH